MRRGRQLLPGVIASVVIAAAASFLSEHYGAPVMLFALLLGMAMNFLSTQDQCRPGIEFAARDVLRVGVALLGMRITLGQIASLGWRPVVLVIGHGRDHDPGVDGWRRVRWASRSVRTC